MISAAMTTVSLSKRKLRLMQVRGFSVQENRGIQGKKLVCLEEGFAKSHHKTHEKSERRVFQSQEQCSAVIECS